MVPSFFHSMLALSGLSQPVLSPGAGGGAANELALHGVAGYGGAAVGGVGVGAPLQGDRVRSPAEAERLAGLLGLEGVFAETVDTPELAAARSVIATRVSHAQAVCSVVVKAHLRLLCRW